MSGPLAGIRVLDLSRVLAAPWTGQNLADLGAEVVKVERPGSGDDSRAFGPPWLKDAQGKETRESAYFACANRGKKSVTVNLSKPEGQRIVRELAAKCDVLLENYKFGDLERFEALLAYAERVYGNRDDNALYTEGLPSGLIRRASLEVGRRLVERGVLRRATDIGYLERSEMAAALANTLTGESAIDRVSRRRAEEAWVRSHPGPLIHGPVPVPPPDLRGFPAACRRLMTAALWAMNEELGPPNAKHADAGALCGVAVSPGRYTGPVRVIRTESELCDLKPGEVLVCPTTHSSWTVAFSKVGALVADGGSILSHPSIIAREHGVPAVVATVSGTSLLRNGELVTVDGNTGRVERGVGGTSETG